MRAAKCVHFAALLYSAFTGKAHVEDRILLVLSIATFVGMAIMVAIQTIVALRYLRLFYLDVASLKASVPDSKLPSAIIILAVRGSDPKLRETIQRLLMLDYPKYRLHILVDSETDPALEIIKEAVEKRPELISMSFLRTPPSSTCSLKCGSLAQAFEEVASEAEVLAFIDGDALPNSNWLRDLVAPLRDHGIGVTTGNRWYVCSQGIVGSLVRFYWNAAAVVQVWFNGIVWAGSMAMRTEFMHKSGLIDEWKTSLSVDGSITRCLKKRTERVQFVPRVMVAIREETTLKSFIVWVRRQMVAALTSGEGWASIVSHGLLIASLQLIPLTILLTSLDTSDLQPSIWALASLCLYWGSGFVLADLLDHKVESTLKSVSQDFIQSTRRISRLKRFGAMLLTNAIYPYVLTTAVFCREVSWRGIRYRLGKHGKVEMLNYQPYHSPDDAKTSQASSVL